MENIKKQLFSMQDIEYKKFHCGLMPTINPETVIGVRTPELRRFANTISAEDAERFIAELPHEYYEENNLHGILLGKIRDYDECVAAVSRFLPYVDNWATCDMTSPRALKKNSDGLIEQIKIWIASGETYTVRFAIKLLMSYYLGEHFSETYLETVATVRSEEYYVKMMVAWYFATALAKQYEAAVPYIENRVLEPWIHNKTIQKSVESNRIGAEQKTYLKEFKIKRKGTL